MKKAELQKSQKEKEMICSVVQELLLKQKTVSF